MVMEEQDTEHCGTNKKHNSEPPDIVSAPGIEWALAQWPIFKVES